MKPKWSSYVQIPSVVLSPTNLSSTIPTAMVTGLVLFAINQLDVVLRGPVSATVWVKSALCFVVPFCVSNVGVLLASRVDGEVDLEMNGRRMNPNSDVDPKGGRK